MDWFSDGKVIYLDISFPFSINIVFSKSFAIKFGHPRPREPPTGESDEQRATGWEGSGRIGSGMEGAMKFVRPQSRNSSQTEGVDQ